MAHFSELDKDPFAAARKTTPARVLRTIVVADQDCVGPNGTEDEATGIAFCKELLGGHWIQTSYNRRFRYHLGAVDGWWDGTGFYAPQPYPSWVLNKDTSDPDTAYHWFAPTSKPNVYTEGHHSWDEDTLTWVRGAPPSWTWNGDLDVFRFEPPVARPADLNGDGSNYVWDEEGQAWNPA